MLEKIFKRSKKKDYEGNDPDIQFGRYSDNNKSMEKVDKWSEADSLFKEKKYSDSIRAFFDYLTDEEENNVVHEPEGEKGKFHFYQGTKIIRGFYSNTVLEAEAVLALMPQPNIPVMRRLLESNFSLYYSRFAKNNDKLCMLFDTDIVTANPSKLYYGLKELATKADKNDDLLIADFTSLRPVDTDHVSAIPEAEKEIKYQYFQKWIKETIALIEGLDADKYSGGIAYLLLALAFRIDYLVVPEGKLLAEMEKIVEIYFKKDDRLVTEKNQDMLEAFQKLSKKSREHFFPYLFRSKYTFPIVNPQSHKTIADAIYNANQNINWYKENKQPNIAAQISEYGISYCQYSYSLPSPVTEYFRLFMMVNYPDYFAELGFHQQFYYPKKEEFNQEAILDRIHRIEEAWKEKYPQMKMKTDKLKFEDMVSFNHSYTTELEYLNLETK